MSTTQITVERVNEVRNHPDADRLDIVQVLGYQVVVGRGQFEVGDSVYYFPPDMMLPPAVSAGLGVQNYLKHSDFPGEGKIQCRVGACRLRGQVSHGFVHPCDTTEEFGSDVTADFGGIKYIAPVRATAGDAAPESYFFPKYTSIENYQRYPEALNGQDVVITEKLHGTNCRVGYVDNKDGEGHQFVAGSHNVARKSGMYWEPLTDEVRQLLKDISIRANGDGNVVIYGEIFGTGVQDMDYGQEGRSFRMFDISVDGKYLDYEQVQVYSHCYRVPMVPILYQGLYSKEVVEEHTYGPTTFQGVKGKFKGREGCVIRPVKETLDYRGNRVILKSVSADYRDRRGAKDIGE